MNSTVDTFTPKVKEIFESYLSNASSSFSYDCLIERVSKHTKLVNWINDKVTHNPKIINLINNNWHKVLENNPTFQEYMNGNVEFFKYDSKVNKNLCNYRVQSYTNNISVIVVGTFKIIEDEINHNFRLKLVECMPLECIAKIMCIKLEKNVLPNAKFFIKTCNGCCIRCRKSNVSSDNIWCVQRTMVYDDADLHYAERKYCTNLYSNETQAIIHLEINSAYTFGDGCKIGGTVESIVFIEHIFNVDNKNIQGCLKTDENYVPRLEKEDDNIQGEPDENSMHHQEFGIKRTIENENCKPVKSETTYQEYGVKRKNEDELENGNKKSLKDTENTNDDILALPKRTNYTKPQGRRYDVKSTIETMPEI